MYTLAAYPSLCKCLNLNEGVDSFVKKGANLMWPGVNDIPGLEEIEVDQVVCFRMASDKR